MILKVWADRELAGALDRDADAGVDTVFAYDLDVPPDRAVSLTMPVGLASIHYPGLHPIFQMNLPEGRLREVLERRFRKVVPGYDALTLLKITGPSQIGRLRYGDDVSQMDAVPTQSVQEILTYQGTEDLFADLVRRFAALSGVSGVQPKVLVRDAESLSGDGRRSLTVRGATHLVKTWDATEFPELAANEYFCLRAAQRAGIPVPAVALSNDGKFLVVERFDLSDDGSYLGFEDGCVLNGLPCEHKYNLSYEAVAKSLRRFVSPAYRPEALAALFRLIALNCAVQNGDAHLKNFGVLYCRPDGDVRLAPAYDIVSTTPYLPNDVMALTLEGRKSFPSAKVLVRFAQMHCGLAPRLAASMLDDVAQAVSETLPELTRYATGRPAFREMATRMQAVWERGIRRSLDRKGQST